MSEDIRISEDDPVSPHERCEECGAPAEWRVRYTGFSGNRNPPYRFFDRDFCDKHLPDEAREQIPEWAASRTCPKCGHGISLGWGERRCPECGWWEAT